MVLIRLVSVRRRWGEGLIRLYFVVILSGSVFLYDIKYYFVYNKMDYFLYESILCESIILV